MMLLQFLFVIFIILLIVDRWKPKKFMKIHQQLGNDWMHLPIFGNALKLLGNNEDRMRVFIESTIQCFKKKYKGISFWVGNIFIVAIIDANDACVVLKSALDKKYIHDVTKDLIGNGSVFAPVEFWHRRRKILVPTFAPRHVSKFVTVFERQSKVTAELLESRIGKGNFSCSDFINFYGLDSLCETVFGVNMDVQRTPDHPFFNALSQCLENIASRVCQPWLFIDAIYTRLPLYSRHQQVIKVLKDFVRDLIIKKKALLDDKERNKEEYEDTTGKPENDFKTFVELMIGSSNETDNKYTDEELREETLVLAVAGSDTSTGAINFTLLLLSQHADIQDRVYKEIQEILGDSDKPLQAEDLLKLKYTRAVIKESIRLYPPVPFILRHCKKDVELPSGLVLPAGCDVVISIWGIQRNPEHWGEDASHFNPDRFMSDKISTPNAFIAFSHGSRNCIGQQYAMLSMTTMLVTLLRRYRFTPAADFKYEKNNPLRLSFDIMMKHVEEYPVRIEYRYKCN